MTYMFDWVGPRAPEAWDRVPLRTPEPYGDHLRPLYNLHQDVACAPEPDATDPATDPASVPADGDWRGLWVDLAASLAGRLERFALVAAEEDHVVGQLRLFPKSCTHPRPGAWDSDTHHQAPDEEVLWLGAAAVDMPAYEDRLPLHLLAYAIDEARRLGCTRLQAVAWSDVPVYALWAQSFPWMVYEAAGFRRISETDGSHLQALPDMLAGHHGAVVHELVTTQLAHSGLTMATAENLAVVEFCLS